LLRITLYLCVGVVLLWLLGGCEDLDASAICPKCLQHAFIHEVRVLGSLAYRKTHLRQAGGGIGSTSAFSPPIPAVDPATYERIHGARCDHQFMYGGVGGTSGMLCARMNWDGFSSQWRSFTPRIGATQALFVAFGKTGDRQTALAVYRLIEEAYPIEGLGLSDRDHAATCYWLSDPDEATLAEALDRLAGDTSPWARASRGAILLRRMAIRLGAVTTAEEFGRALAEFTPKLKGP
jgi:hypothetical protein